MQKKEYFWQFYGPNIAVTLTIDKFIDYIWTPPD